jgi:N-acetylneuraminic acid mutarotase
MWYFIDRLEWSRYCPEAIPPVTLIHTMSGFGSTLYVFGGRTIEGQFLNDIYTFDLHKFDDGWHLLPVHGSVPAPRSGHSMMVHEEELYM